MNIEVLARDLAAIEADAVKKLPKAFRKMAGPAALRAVWSDLAKREPMIETVCEISDPFVQRVFSGLCARYGIEPYQRPGQPLTEACIRAPRTFVRKVLWPIFEAMSTRVSEEITAGIAAAMSAWGAPVPRELSEEER